MRTIICRRARLNVWRRIGVSADGTAAAYWHRITGEIVVLTDHGRM